MKKIVAFFVALTLVPVCLWAQPPVKVMTEKLPPFNYVKHGRVVGISSELVKHIFEQAQVPLEGGDIQVYPWARAYSEVQTIENTALFSTARTEEREALFQWVGPLVRISLGIVARKDRQIIIDSVEDLKRYRIGTVRESAPEQLLIKTGVTADRLERLVLPHPNIKKLDSGRIDLFAFNLQVIQHLMKDIGVDPAQYETVHVLKETELYLVLHKDTDPAVVEKLQQSLDAMKQPDADGTSLYRSILNRYLCCDISKVAVD